MKEHAACVILTVVASVVQASACELGIPDRLDGFEKLDYLTYVDLPDPDTVRATATIERSLVDEMVRSATASVTKIYCEIGIQNMVVDFSVPVEDDAISAFLTRAIFVWDASDDPIGWRLDALGKRPLCARGNDPFAPICP